MIPQEDPEEDIHLLIVDQDLVHLLLLVEVLLHHNEDLQGLLLVFFYYFLIEVTVDHHRFNQNYQKHSVLICRDFDVFLLRGFAS